jgi:hypothetical protein
MLISSICTSTGLFCVLSVTDSLAVTGPIGRAISGDPQALIAKTDSDRMRGRHNAFVNAFIVIMMLVVLICRVRIYKDFDTMKLKELKIPLRETDLLCLGLSHKPIYLYTSSRAISNT